jgi:hypothetical protein
MLDTTNWFPRGVRRRLAALMFSPAAARVAAGLYLLIALGCMSFTIGGRGSDEVRPATEDVGMLTQEGKVPVRPGSEQLIYYPVSYASPPNLELEDPFHVSDIVDQKENCFRVRFHESVASADLTLLWKARGVRGPSAPAAAPTAASETSPPAVIPPPAPLPGSTVPTSR